MSLFSTFRGGVFLTDWRRNDLAICDNEFLFQEQAISISETLLLISGDKWMYCGWGNNMIVSSDFAFFKPLRIETPDECFLKYVLMFWPGLSILEENRQLSLSTEKESAL